MLQNPEFTVTDGSVEYKHSKPIGEYDNKTPLVRLNYQIAEGADPAVATAKVMGIAMEIVERAIATNVTVQQVAEVPPDGYGIVGNEVLPVKARRGRPPANPTTVSSVPAPTDAVSVTEQDAAVIVDEPVDAPVTDPTDMAGIDSADEDADLGLVPTEQQPVENVVSDADLQAQAQKVSAHLRKEFNNINDLRKLISSCGGVDNLLTIPADKRYAFMQQSRGLLAMKK